MKPGETSLPVAEMVASAGPAYGGPGVEDVVVLHTTLPRSWTSCVLPLNATTQPPSMCVRMFARSPFARRL